MQKKKLKGKNYLLVIIVMLLISLIFNVVIIMKNLDYQYRIGIKSYNNIENIKCRSENNIKLLDSVIEVETIYNMDILKLYQSYASISDSFISLWDEYSFYEDSRQSRAATKKIDTKEALLNDINGNIEDYLRSMLEVEMKTNAEKRELSGETLEQFKEMRSLSMEINNFYKDFCENQLKISSDEDKKDKIIKKFYWIDVLEGMNKINGKYSDTDFLIKQ